MVITAEQREERRHYIGASEVPGIVGLSPFAGSNAASIWLKKVKGAQQKSTPAMDYGNDVEPILIRWASEKIAEKLGTEVDRYEENPEFSTVISEKKPSTRHSTAPITSHLDAMLYLKDGTQVVLEAKTSRFEEDYGTAWTDEVPAHVVCQVMTQMALSEVDVSYVVVDLLNGTRKIYRVDFDSDIWDTLRSECEYFWHEYVLKQKRPEGKISVSLLESIDRHEPDNVLVLTGNEAQDLIDKVERWEEHKAETNRLKKGTEECRMQILEGMGDHSVVVAGNLQVELGRTRKVLKVTRL